MSRYDQGEEELDLAQDKSFTRLDDLQDSRVHTCEVIYERRRRIRLEGSIRTTLIVCLSILLSISAIVSISLLQYDEYFAFINDRNDYIENTHAFCEKASLANIDIISTPIAAFLLILYVILYKRRILWRYKFKYRNFGIPMMISLWNKTDRVYSAITYGAIAFNIYNIVRNYIDSNEASIIPFKDPSGVLPLLVKVMQVFLLGIRYYPVLVAYRANSFIICVLTALYMWIDFIENIYHYGKCESISSETSSGKEETKRRLWYFIAYKILSSIPLSIFSSFIVINLTYKGTILLFDFLFRKNLYKSRQIDKARDTFCCSIFNVDDDNELLYCKHDVEYVYDLFNANKETSHGHHASHDEKGKPAVQANGKPGPQAKKPPAKVGFMAKLQGMLKKNDKTEPILQYSELRKIKKPNILTKIISKVYKWDYTFRFSSRFVNSMVVALVALYYVWLYWSYLIVTKITEFTDTLPDQFDLRNFTINPGEILCSLSENVCVEQLIEMGSFPVPIPKKVYDVMGYVKSSVNAIAIVPLFGALLICLLQLLLFVKDCKTHLMQMYRGECEYVLKAKNLKNHKIAASSFHFGGYLVGYLIWGFFILYAFWTIVGLVILGIRIFAGDGMFGGLALKIIPIITVLIFKTIVNVVASRFAFTMRHTKMLALNNFRAFNIFLYFNFYYDCFMGIISAVIRLIKSVLAAIFYMPRISYSFFGRHLERMDNGYSCYSGFLHMESMHTNPIITTFCSILYYTDLSEFIRRHHIEKKLKSQHFPGYELKLASFDGMLPVAEQPIVHPYLRKLNMQPDLNPKIKYNQFVRNKWHVCLMLIRNRDLVKFRKRNWVKKPEAPHSGGMLVKAKKFICATPCAKYIRSAKTADSTPPISRTTSARPDSSKSNKSANSAYTDYDSYKPNVNTINLKGVLIRPEDEKSLKQLKVQDIDEFNSRTFF